MRSCRHVNRIGPKPFLHLEEPTVVQTSPECRAGDARSTPRASIYLAATLYCDGSSAPVKIRNLSATGALVESGVTPIRGALVQLIRGGLIVHGLVAWSSGNRCGLKFSGRVDVEQWRGARTNVEQQRVDDIVRVVKAGAVPLPVPSLTALPAGEAISASCPCSASDLQRVSKLLEQLAGVLADDAEIVKRHGPILQNLDIAMQFIAAIGAMNGQTADATATDLAGLRRSADQALQRTV